MILKRLTRVFLLEYMAEGTTDGESYWECCFIWQKKKKDKCCFAEEGISSLGKMLQKFYYPGRLYVRLTK